MSLKVIPLSQIDWSQYPDASQWERIPRSVDEKGWQARQYWLKADHNVVISRTAYDRQYTYLPRQGAANPRQLAQMRREAKIPPRFAYRQKSDKRHGWYRSKLLRHPEDVVDYIQRLQQISLTISYIITARGFPGQKQVTSPKVLQQLEEIEKLRSNRKSKRLLVSEMVWVTIRNSSLTDYIPDGPTIVEMTLAHLQKIDAWSVVWRFTGGQS